VPCRAVNIYEHECIVYNAFREIGVRKVLALCAALGLELSATARRARPTLQELRDEQRGGKPRA
jgi:hypothetical protein